MLNAANVARWKSLYRTSCPAKMKSKKLHEENVAPNFSRMVWNASSNINEVIRSVLNPLFFLR